MRDLVLFRSVLYVNESSLGISSLTITTRFTAKSSNLINRSRFLLYYLNPLFGSVAFSILLWLTLKKSMGAVPPINV